MLIASTAILFGFIMLMWSADRFITGSAATAGHLGISPLLIGIIIVGFGTSLPEMMVSAGAALDGNPDLALGNALGSNIVNTGLVLGVTALIAPVIVHSTIVRKEIPILITIGGVFGFFIWDGELSRAESSLLLFGFFSLIAWSVYSAGKRKEDHLGVEVGDNMSNAGMPMKPAIFWLLLGLVLLVLSSKLLVWGAVSIATELGVSSLVIGLTVVALGTSLPELAASVVAATKGQHDIAIGNVVGSNMFNLLAVGGIAGFISPIQNINADVLFRDWPMVMALTIMLLFMCFGYGKQSQLSRLDGSILFVAFIAYNTYLISSII